MEKIVNIKVKTLLELPTEIQEIDSRYPQKDRPAKKEEKNSGKTKSTDTPSANVSSGKH